ncbi:MAG: nucleotidyltransferase family protein [Muribaculaceae bacterium]
MKNNYDILMDLLQPGLGTNAAFSAKPTADQWRWIHAEAVRQAVIGPTYAALEHISSYSDANAVTKPPTDILMRWAMETQQLKALNIRFDTEASRLTRIFDDLRMYSVILKGQGNALLYPKAAPRTPGDIDIFVEGGKREVLNVLRRKGLLNEDDTPSYHHAHMKSGDSGIIIEVHYRPSSGLSTPWRNYRFQRILNEEIHRSQMTDKGFRVPTPTFNLLMQLAHIQRHFINSGIGLRQIIDFGYVMLNASAADVERCRKLLSGFGMKRVAQAVMWIACEKLGFTFHTMLASPSQRWGEMLLAHIANEGNFGQFAVSEGFSFLHRIAVEQVRKLRLIPMCPSEVVWGELRYLYSVLLTMPERFRKRRLALGDRRLKVVK